MLDEKELEGIGILALQLRNAKEQFDDSGKGAEQLLHLQQTLAKYVGPLLKHIADLEKKLRPNYPPMTWTAGQNDYD